MQNLDKEAQEKLEAFIRSEIQSYTCTVCIACAKSMASKIASKIRELGYRKLPKDKPPLLSDIDLELILSNPLIDDDDDEILTLKTMRAVAQTQWGIWNEWYEAIKGDRC